MEEVKYEEKADYDYEKDLPNDTQIFLENIFSKRFEIEGYRFKFGKDERLDWEEYLYQWFEIYKKGGRKKICFGYWDEHIAGVRWFIDKTEVDLIKSKLKPKN